MTMPVPRESPSEHPPETLSGLAVSLVFWLTMLTSAALFAMVALAPKYLTYLQLRNQFETNQLRLVSYEQQADQIEKVIDAIHRDKDFAEELARVEFDTVRPGEEVIPVDAGLELDARHQKTIVPTAKAVQCWYEPVVRMFASDGPLRLTLLAAAALLVVVSFAFLQPGGSECGRGTDGDRSLWSTLRSRYVREVQ